MARLRDPSVPSEKHLPPPTHQPSRSPSHFFNGSTLCVPFTTAPPPPTTMSSSRKLALFWMLRSEGASLVRQRAPSATLAWQTLEKTELSAKAKLEFAITFANTESQKRNSCVHFENRSKTGRGYDQPLEGRDGSGLSRSWRQRPRRPRRLGIHIRSRSVELFPSSHAEKGRPVERGHGGSPAQGKSLKEGAWSLGPAPSSRLDLKNSSPY